MALDAVIQQATRRRDALAQRLATARVRRQAAGLEAERCEQAVAEIAGLQTTLGGMLTTVGQWQQWESSLEAARAAAASAVAASAESHTAESAAQRELMEARRQLAIVERLAARRERQDALQADSQRRRTWEDLLCGRGDGVSDG